MSSYKSKLKEGEILFNEGSFSDCAYIVQSGALEVTKKDKNGRKIVLAVLKKNDIVGEMGLIDGQPRSATVTAIKETSIAILTRKQFNSLSKRNPNALIPLMKVLAGRLRDSLSKSPGIRYVQKIPRQTSITV